MLCAVQHVGRQINLVYRDRTQILGTEGTENAFFEARTVEHRSALRHLCSQKHRRYAHETEGLATGPQLLQAATAQPVQ